VSVNPLEWRPRSSAFADDWKVETVVGRYDVGIVHVNYTAIRRSIERGSEADTVLVRGVGLEVAKAAAQADYEQRIRSALQTVPAHSDARQAAEDDDDWRDDPASDERWNAGCDFAMERLCSVLGVAPQRVRWDAATETLDGDVCSVIGNIIEQALGENWQDRALPLPGDKVEG